MIETGSCSWCGERAERFTGGAWQHIGMPCSMAISLRDQVVFVPDVTEDQAVLDEHRASRTPG